ncbi:hypothetical protein FQA39_LY06122 [Lamprigera yunnana]|nr:hypothetical protein FQA39_LY06122 [Lamprigera yunnana]
MKLYFVCLGLLVAVRAEQKPAAAPVQERRVGEKQDNENAGPLYYRLASQSYNAQKSSPNGVNYNPQAIYSSQPLNYLSQLTLKANPSAIPAHIMYGFAPQLQSQPQPHQQQQQQHSEYEPQQIIYSQPINKQGFASAKHHAPAPAPINFSPASEVSSFRFASPLVTYSNQGVLSQVTGKLASSSATHAPQEVQPTHSPKPTALPTTATPVPYSVIPQFAYNTVGQQEQQDYDYVQSSQAAFAAAVPQRVFAMQLQAVAQKENYAQAPKQYYAVIPQQVAYSPQVGHSPAGLQFAYALAIPQGGHSNSQQVYSVPSQVKYVNANSAADYNQ